MRTRTFLSLGLASCVAALTGCTTTSGGGSSDPADTRRKIDAGVDAALHELYAVAPGSRELVQSAKGVLVFPSVVSVGFMVGGSHGQGALRKSGLTTAYYTTSSASVGLLAGAETKAVYLLFMNQDSLAKFETSKGWTVGADASVTMLSLSADAHIDSKPAQQPIIGLVRSKGGLMANLSLDGTKFNRIENL